MLAPILSRMKLMNTHTHTQTRKFLTMIDNSSSRVKAKSTEVTVQNQQKLQWGIWVGWWGCSMQSFVFNLPLNHQRRRGLIW